MCRVCARGQPLITAPLALGLAGSGEQGSCESCSQLIELLLEVRELPLVGQRLQGGAQSVDLATGTKLSRAALDAVGDQRGRVPIVAGSGVFHEMQVAGSHELSRTTNSPSDKRKTACSSWLASCWASLLPGSKESAGSGRGGRAGCECGRSATRQRSARRRKACLRSFRRRLSIRSSRPRREHCQEHPRGGTSPSPWRKSMGQVVWKI